MDEYTDGYADYVMGIIADMEKAGVAPMVFIEERLDLSPWVPESFGTADCIVIGDEILHVVDLK